MKKLIPKAKIAYTGEVGADPRNYRVKFDLLNKLLPDFKLQYDLAAAWKNCTASWSTTVLTKETGTATNSFGCAP